MIIFLFKKIIYNNIIIYDNNKYYFKQCIHVIVLMMRSLNKSIYS